MCHPPLYGLAPYSVCVAFYCMVKFLYGVALKTTCFEYINRKDLLTLRARQIYKIDSIYDLINFSVKKERTIGIHIFAKCSNRCVDVSPTICASFYMLLFPVPIHWLSKTLNHNQPMTTLISFVSVFGHLSTTLKLSILFSLESINTCGQYSSPQFSYCSKAHP